MENRLKVALRFLKKRRRHFSKNNSLMCGQGQRFCQSFMPSGYCIVKMQLIKYHAGQLGLSGFSRPHAVEENRWAQVTWYKQLEKNVADIYSIPVHIMLSQLRQLTHWSVSKLSPPPQLMIDVRLIWHNTPSSTLIDSTPDGFLPQLLFKVWFTWWILVHSFCD